MPPPEPQPPKQRCAPQGLPAATTDGGHAAAPALAAVEEAVHADCRRPVFHPMTSRGWASDPSGPIYFRGRYHLFFQHLPRSVQWNWGLSWSHCVSEDLVTWRALPPVLVPTPAWFDADGCFSGTVELDPESGLPTILYTGVYLKSNADAVAALGLPPTEKDLGLRFVETQLAAVPEDPDDPDLTVWRKLPNPLMTDPPPGLPLSCWRDPYCLERGDPATGREWTLLLASGLRGRGGAVLVFKSLRLLTGWRFEGLVAQSDSEALGIDWECPILARLEPLPPAGSPLKPPPLTVATCCKGPCNGCSCDAKPCNGGSSGPLQAPLGSDGALDDSGNASDSGAASDGSPSSTLSSDAASHLSMDLASCTAADRWGLAAPDDDLAPAGADKDEAPAVVARSGGTGSSAGGGRWFFCISPDACNNPIHYFLGDYDGGRFHTAGASGPHRLDLGRTLYAATLWRDPQGRDLLWAWIQEHRRVPPPPCECTDFEYAGCVSLPRCLHLTEGAPCSSRHCQSASYRAANLLLPPISDAEPPLPLPRVAGTHLDVSVTFCNPGPAAVAAAAAAASHSTCNSDGCSSNVTANGGGASSSCGCVDAAGWAADESFGEPTNSNSSSGARDAITAATTTAAASSAHSSRDLPGAARQQQQPRRRASWPDASDAIVGPAVGLVLKSWRPEGRGAAVVAFSWATRRLEVHFDEPFPNAYDPYPASIPGANVVGGTLSNRAAGDDLTLRLLLDGSVLEIFTGSGETLTTRVYRGHPPEALLIPPPAGNGKEGKSGEPPSGVCLFASGAACVVASVEAYELGSCWQAPAASPAAPAAAAPAGDESATAAAVGAKEDEEEEGQGPAVVRSTFLHDLHVE